MRKILDYVYRTQRRHTSFCLERNISEHNSTTDRKKEENRHIADPWFELNLEKC